ncbi:MAG: TIGR03936 family radical SAM-associated protein [Candidatus Omnitrophota bacterium]
MVNESKIYRIIFAKKGNMKYISHLDLVRLFQRATRRADIPVALSKGFSPRPKIRFKRALKLGVESEAEEAVFQLTSSLSLDDFKNRLQRQLPEGISIKHVEVIG